MKLHSCFLFLALFLGSAFTLTLPESSGLIAAPTNGTLGGPPECDRGKRFTFKRPRFQDCGQAIGRIRNNPVVAIFHSGGVRNQWQLPITDYHGTCNVNVEMKEGIVEEEASWTQLRTALAGLNQACVGTYPFSDLQGGYAYEGTYDGIKLVLSYRPTEASLVGSNGTVVVAEGNGTVGGLVSVD